MAGYWEQRQLETYKAGEMQVNQYFSKLEKAFNKTKRELQKTVESFYWRYAEENGLTYAAAQRQLDKAEIGELQDFIELSMKNIGKYNQEVNNLSIKARMTRYQALEAQVDAMLRQLYAVDYQAEAEKTMQEVYGEAYNRTWYNIDQYRGFHSNFAQVDPAAVERLLEYPFNGANFSSRLWKQKDHLQTVLMEAVTTILVQGVPPQKLAADFAKKMNSKKFDAYRLLHTESSFLISEATHAGYQADDVEKYQILATLDSKTCGICGDLDGKIYSVEEAVTGKNMPPFHCFCRCTDVPYYDDTDLEDLTRVARDPETGKVYEVPADMTYPEWKQKYIKKGEEIKQKKADYLVRNNKTAGNTTKERLTANEAIASVPPRVQEQIHSGTIIDVGQIGSSQYDYTRDILYVAKGAEKEDIVHEIGHMVENRMMDPDKITQIRKKIIGEVDIWDIKTETYYDNEGNPVDIFLLENDRFVSQYQGRIYADTIWDAFDNDGNFRDELMMEFVSEPFREYIADPEVVKGKCRELYDLIEEAVK